METRRVHLYCFLPASSAKSCLLVHFVPQEATDSRCRLKKLLQRAAPVLRELTTSLRGSSPGGDGCENRTIDERRYVPYCSSVGLNRPRPATRRGNSVWPQRSRSLSH